MPTLVAPSILSADFAHLGDDIDDLVAKGADWIHVDVMDGRFVPNLTLGPVIVEAASRHAAGHPVDVHLMMVEPERYLEAFREAGADHLTVHPEACTHLHRTLQQIQELGARPGVALNPHTSETVLDYVYEQLGLIMIMTVNPGFGGQSMIEATLPKITRIREALERRGLNDVYVQVDGGVKPDNAWRFVEAGADVLVSGSGVFGAKDRGAAIAGLRRAARG